MVAQQHGSTSGTALADGSFRRWLGAHLVRVHGTAIELLLPYRDEFGDAHGQIQRAIVAGLADIAGDAVRRLRQDAGATLTVRLQYIGAARAGSTLHAHAWLASDHIHIDVRSNDDRALIARATMTLAIPAESVLHYPSQPRYPV